jgi:hypothetical protein
MGLKVVAYGFKNPDKTDLSLFPQCPIVLEFRNSGIFPDILASRQLKGFCDTFETFGKRHRRMLLINNQSDTWMVASGRPYLDGHNVCMENAINVPYINLNIALIQGFKKIDC